MNTPTLQISTNKPNSELVRRKAYELWEASGCPVGRAEEHWFKAEKLLLEEMAPSAVSFQPANGNGIHRSASRTPKRNSRRS